QYALTVAVLGERPQLRTPPVQELARAAPGGDLATEFVQHYPSAPGIEPPQIDVRGPQAGTVAPQDEVTPGLTAIGVKNGFGQKGPMLIDDAGEPVWFQPLTGVDARDVQVQRYHGEPVITWWEGLMAGGFGYGEAVIADSSYQEVARVNMAGGYDADSHVVRLTDQGTMLLIGYEPVRMDLSHVGGPADGVVVDNVIQEVDPRTGAMLYEWHSVGQVALAESYLPVPGQGDELFDYFHANSVHVDDDGDLLISARHTCAVYSLDRRSGHVEWRLGGSNSDFEMGAGAFFIKQHDARRSSDGTVTVLDNGGECGEISREVTRGLALELDEEAMTAQVAREYRHPEAVFSASQANFQELPGGQVFFGWGSVPRYTLMDAGGEVLLDGSIPEELVTTSYRAHRVEWTGRPATRPNAVLSSSGAGDVVRVSWNGATEVASWQVVNEAGDVLAEAPRDGFETDIPVPAPAGAGLQVQALDAAGATIGQSPVTAVSQVRWNELFQ
ncbi:MAG TPA: arylsulfotransferase family protein, partial [Beutenbergiaceae bacterium]|nr:arylsulfotransferase family protein [Beutenbergiaceae bacterium]